jgi:hypothetical protein
MSLPFAFRLRAPIQGKVIIGLDRHFLTFRKCQRLFAGHSLLTTADGGDIRNDEYPNYTTEVA